MDSKYCAWTKASIAGKPEELGTCDTEHTVEWFNTLCEFPENMFKIKLFFFKDPGNGATLCSTKGNGWHKLLVGELGEGVLGPDLSGSISDIEIFCCDQDL